MPQFEIKSGPEQRTRFPQMFSTGTRGPGASPANCFFKLIHYQGKSRFGPNTAYIVRSGYKAYHCAYVWKRQSQNGFGHTNERQGANKMKKLFKAALVVVSLTGFQALGTVAANASETGLLRYAQDPASRNVNLFKPFKVASRRSRRRNRAIAGGIAVGIAALIISEAIRSKRHRYYDDDYYYDNRSYNYRSSYPGYRQCNKWARRCDWGNNRACRKWNRRCR